MISSNRLFTALTLVVASLSGACGSSGASVPDEPVPAPAPGGDGGGGGGGPDAAPPTPKADPVNDTPAPSDINEMLGVFVARTGAANGDGSRAHPLLTVQAGIDRAKSVGKRVYVCSGTYAEALVLADSISVIGGMDCSAPIWKVGGARSRIESPSSPAVLAKDIKTATRLEGLDIVAPNATAPGASSIGVFADHAPAITLAKSSVMAGNAADGANGVDGIQLTLDAAAAKGGASLPEEKCVAGATDCKSVVDVVNGGKMWRAFGAGGGTSVCAGAPNHNGEAGGSGGGGGVYVAQNVVARIDPGPPARTFYTGTWATYTHLGSAEVPSAGEARSLVPPPNGQPGSNGGAIGTLTPDGYVGVPGTVGTDGSPGHGGYGGHGGAIATGFAGVSNGDLWTGKGAPGGGGGGCPGLAGTAGRGGGASIALALLESPLVIDATQLTAGKGGAGGHGSFGSDATPGGAPGLNATLDASNDAAAGGRGGSAGPSANGSSGPSVGIMHVGAAATLVNGGRATPGTGGAAVPEQSKTDDGGTRMIPASPEGVSKDIQAL